MGESPMMQMGVRRGWIRATGALLVASSSMLSMGCNAFAPSALGSLTASSEEKRVLEQAAVDSFPSPADVGLDQDEAQP